MEKIEIGNFTQNLKCDAETGIKIADETLFEANFTRLMDDYCGRNLTDW